MTKCTCIYGPGRGVLQVVLRDPDCPAATLHDAAGL